MRPRNYYKWAPKGTLKTIVTNNGGACVTCGKAIARGETVLFRTRSVYVAHPACGYDFLQGNYQ